MNNNSKKSIFGTLFILGALYLMDKYTPKSIDEQYRSSAWKHLEPRINELEMLIPVVENKSNKTQFEIQQLENYRKELKELRKTRYNEK